MQRAGSNNFLWATTGKDDNGEKRHSGTSFFLVSDDFHVQDIRHRIGTHKSDQTASTSSGDYSADPQKGAAKTLIPRPEGLETKRFARRFYILLLFSLTAFLQYCAWNTFGPISSTCIKIFQWSQTEVALMASLDPITYLLTMLFFSWVMDVKGLRVSMLISLFFMAFGTGLRCLTTNLNYVTWSMAAGQFFNGLAGPVTQAAPPLLSANWFPPEQRTTATAVASLCGSMGVALSFLIGPAAVKEVDWKKYRYVDLHSNITDYMTSTNKTFQLNPEHLKDTIYQDASHYWSFDNVNVAYSVRATDVNDQHRAMTEKLNGRWKFNDLKGKEAGFISGQITRKGGPVGQSIDTMNSGFLSLGHYTDNCLEDIVTCGRGLSVAFWLRYSNTSSKQMQYFLGTGGSGAGFSGFVVFHNPRFGSRPLVSVRLGTGQQRWKLSFDAPFDHWNHVVITWTMTEGLKVYLNGTLSAHAHHYKDTIHRLPDSSTLTIGKGNNLRYLSRTEIDELVIWERNLHPAEIRVIYLRNIGVTRDPMAVRKEEERQDIVKERTQDIMYLLYGEFGAACLLFIAVIIYFPDKPPIPPSISAHVKREDFLQGAKRLARSKQFWILALIYGITTGVYSGWGAVLNLNLRQFGVTQDESGWLGFYAVLAGIGAGLLLARCADFFGGHMKALLLVLFFGSTGCFLWFSLLCVRIIDYTPGSLYKSAILGGFFVSGTIPLFYELTIESTYPVAEGITTGALTLINNFFTVTFLIITMTKDLGTSWMNWALAGSCALCIPVLLIFRESYRRLKIDMNEPGPVEVEKGHMIEESEYGCEEAKPLPAKPMIVVTSECEVLDQLDDARESDI